MQDSSLFNLDAEKAIICCLLTEPKLAEVAEQKFVPECFYHDQTAIVYAAIMHLRKKLQTIDTITVSSYLRDVGKLDAAGGASAISELYTFLPIPGVFDEYAEILIEKHAQRQIVNAASNIVKAVKGGELKTASILENAIAEFQQLQQSRLNSADMLPCRQLHQIVHEIIDNAEDRARNQNRIPGITTGFNVIDQATGGQQPGRLWVIAAETSEGKSTIVQNFVECACEDGNAGVIYSFEMPDTECVERLLCSQGPVNASSLVMGLSTREEQETLVRATRRIHQWNLSVVDVSDATIEQICRDIALRVAALRKVNKNARMVAAIDYLQLANTLQKFDNRERAVAHISKTAKQCAKANQITIHMPSQLNDDGRLRESRAIAHDADVVMLIRKPADAKKDEQDKRELFCAKNRGGKRNWSMPIKLQGQHFRFVAP